MPKKGSSRISVGEVYGSWKVLEFVGVKNYGTKTHNIWRDLSKVSNEPTEVLDEPETIRSGSLPTKGQIMTCQIPPEGWSCSRESGHEGPCAASADGYYCLPDDVLVFFPGKPKPWYTQLWNWIIRR